MKRLFKGFILALAALMAAFCLFAACDSNSGNGNENGNENGGDTAATAISITGAPADLSLDVGEKVTLGYTLSPAGAAGSVVWSSSDDTKATVSSSGEVEGVAAGSVIITATVSGTTVSDKVALTVVAPVVANPVTDIAVSAEGLSEGALTMQRGQTVSLTVANTPEDCDAYTLDWTTDKTGVVEVVRTVDGYDLVADGYGTAEVTATVSGTDIADSFTVTVDGDVDDSNGIMTETFSRGEIDPEGLYYTSADKTTTLDGGAPIYHGAFFDVGTRVTGATPLMDLSADGGKLNWQVTSPGNYERITFRYNGAIDNDEIYIVRVPMTVESVSDAENGLNYRFAFGYREKASDDDMRLTYNNIGTNAPEFNFKTYSEGGTYFFGFTEVGETKYIDFRVSANWNGEVYIFSHADQSVGAKGTMTVSFDNVQIIRTSEIAYGDEVETFENATAEGKKITADNMVVTSNGDALGVSNAVNADKDAEGNPVSGLAEKITHLEIGPDSELAPSTGKFVIWTTSRVFAEGSAAGDNQKIIFTFDADMFDASKSYTIDIPVQVRMAALDAESTFDIADLQIKAYDSEDTSNLLATAEAGTFAADGANAVISVTIEAGSDWGGVVCLRLYNAQITETPSAKLRLFFDNITISEAVSE